MKKTSNWDEPIYPISMRLNTDIILLSSHGYMYLYYGYL